MKACICERPIETAVLRGSSGGRLLLIRQPRHHGSSIMDKDKPEKQPAKRSEEEKDKENCAGKEGNPCKKQNENTNTPRVRRQIREHPQDTF